MGVQWKTYNWVMESNDSHHLNPHRPAPDFGLSQLIICIFFISSTLSHLVEKIYCIYSSFTVFQIGCMALTLNTLLHIFLTHIFNIYFGIDRLKWLS
jgi:hypothetical protein